MRRLMPKIGQVLQIGRIGNRKNYDETMKMSQIISKTNPSLMLCGGSPFPKTAAGTGEISAWNEDGDKLRLRGDPRLRGLTSILGK